jgi:hypothetical protein
MMTLHGSLGDQHMRKLTMLNILCHDQNVSFEECLVHLHHAAQVCVILRQMHSESFILPPDHIIRKIGELHCLLYWHFICPAPAEQPEDLQRQLQILEPGMGQQRKFCRIFSASVPFLHPDDVPAPAERTMAL